VVLSFQTAQEISMDAFLAVSAESEFQPQLREYADSLLRQGNTRPDWCVIGLHSDAPVARGALWSVPDAAAPTDLVLIDADWGEPDFAGGKGLLAHVHELASTLGASQLQHHVDAPPGPPQYQENEAERIRLLLETEYELLRDGLRWLHRSPSEAEQGSEPRLDFRGLGEVGEDVFVEALAATYEGTRDSWLTRNIEERGLHDAARADFLDYRQMDHQPEWWELAYTDDGALAGVVMAARNPSSAVVAYVGVVPEQRGRGLAAQLVRRGTEQVAAGGATEVRGDCDSDNVAMVKAFRRAGFEQTARRRSYLRTLSV
jgi:ribosomal protein S18 acetylase RimI-like enzyme